jgi:alpha-glucosidase
MTVNPNSQAKDEHILSGTLLNSQMGLAGIPFVGPDLGGNIGDGNKELFHRWVEIGIFLRPAPQSTGEIRAILGS